MGGLFAVVPSIEGIRSSQDRRSGIQRCSDTCLGNRHSLLFHHFVDCCSIVLAHLVELIDTADSHVGQDQSPSLKEDLIGHWVHDDGCGQPHTGTALPSGIDPSWGHMRNVLQQLRFSNPWIPDQSDVDLPSDPQVVVSDLGDASHHQQQKRLLDRIHSIDLRRNGTRHLLEELIFCHARPH